MPYLVSIILPLQILTLLAALASDAARFSLTGRRAIYTSLAFAWVLVTLLRPWGASPDDWNYAVHLRLTHSLADAEFRNTLGHSPFYYFLLSAVRVLFDDHIAFMVIACAALSLKFLIIGRLTEYSLLALFAYVSIFWMLHDVVQLRAGVATLFLLLIIYWWGMERRAGAISFAVIAPFFHISSIISLACVPIDWVFKHRLKLALGVAFGSQVLAAVGLGLPGGVFELLNITDERALTSLDFEGESNTFRFTSLAILLALAFAIPGMKGEYPKYVRLAFYSVIAGFLLYWIASSSPNVANRLMQFLWMPLVLLAPRMRTNPVTYFGFVGVCLAYFYLSGWINGLMDFGGKWGAFPSP